MLRVVTRVRPSKEGEATVVHVEGDFVHVDYRGSEKPFLFNAVLQLETTQAEVHIQTHTWLCDTHDNTDDDRHNGTHIFLLLSFIWSDGDLSS